MCPSAPQTCRTAQKSLLLIKNKADNSKDKLIWKWLKGAATTTAEFADPTVDRGLRAVHLRRHGRHAGGADAHPAELTKWKAIGTKGFKYLDPTSARTERRR